MTGARPAPDWTVGPPKRAAMAVLALFALLGLFWSLATGRQADRELPWEAATASSAAAPFSFTRSIDLNTAAAAELELLPGIGPALASRILEDRTARGPYASVEDLSRVRGIGPRLIHRIRPHAAVTTEPAGAAPPIP